MRRRILVNGVLYAWYRDAGKQRPTVTSFPKQAARHREVAARVFGELQQRFPTARLADGRIVVEAVRAECRALLEK